MINTVRLNLLFIALTIASFANAGEGRGRGGKLAGPVEHAAPKPVKMAARAENNGKDDKNPVGQAGGNSVAASVQHPKKQLTKEERQALRRQINQAGGTYPNKN